VKIDSIQATLTSITDDTPPAANLSYRIEVPHPTGCQPTQTSKVLQYNSAKSNISKRTLPTGIDEFQVSGYRLQVYPNPNSGIFNLTFRKNPNKLIYLNIYNIAGESIYELPISPKNNKSYKIDIFDQPVGVYFVEVQLGKDIITGKIMITK